MDNRPGKYKGRSLLMTCSSVLYNPGNGREVVEYLSLGPFDHVTVELCVFRELHESSIYNIVSKVRFGLRRYFPSTPPHSNLGSALVTYYTHTDYVLTRIICPVAITIKHILLLFKHFLQPLLQFTQYTSLDLERSESLHIPIYQQRHVFKITTYLYLNTSLTLPDFYEEQ